MPDKKRYTLNHINGHWELRFTNGDLATGNSFTPAFDAPITTNKANIIMLLESPHTDEYAPDFTPLGPAQGETGMGIHYHFTSHVLPMLTQAGLKLSTRREYSICLVNPVQYQASLGNILTELNGPLRDNVWLELWGACRQEFQRRLLTYRPVVILNGCTSKAKTQVTTAIHSFRSAQVFNTNHPSFWRRTLAGFREG